MINELKQWIPPFCLGAGVATALVYYQKLKQNENSSVKTLDEYSYRDLFHFFVNPEFHTDKLHLAKGQRNTRQR